MRTECGARAEDDGIYLCDVDGFGVGGVEGECEAVVGCLADGFGVVFISIIELGVAGACESKRKQQNGQCWNLHDVQRRLRIGIIL